MIYFDCQKAGREAGIPADELDQLAELCRLEEPHDPMLAELHTMRSCMAIQQGRITIEEALAEARKLAACVGSIICQDPAPPSGWLFIVLTMLFLDGPQ
jgi:hypothetical protein